MPGEKHDTATLRPSGQMRPRAGHICTPFSGFTGFSPHVPSAMVSKERIKEEGLTQSEVMDKMTAEPKRSVEILPEWEEYPEEAPGENVRIEDDVLIWERDGFEARLESYETTHWRAEVDIPDRVGSWFPRAIDMQCRSTPERGFVEDVEIEDYCATMAVIIISENFQPTWEVNKFIDDLEEYAEGSEEFQEEMEEKLSLAESEE